MIQAIDGAQCEHCSSVNTVQVVPDRHPMSPWECLDCGAVFGTDRTDGGLLAAFGHGPVDKSIQGDFEADVCIRCGRDLSDQDESRMITEKGQVCEDCTTEDEAEDI